MWLFKVLWLLKWMQHFQNIFFINISFSNLVRKMHGQILDKNVLPSIMDIHYNCCFPHAHDQNMYLKCLNKNGNFPGLMTKVVAMSRVASPYPVIIFIYMLHFRWWWMYWQHPQLWPQRCLHKWRWQFYMHLYSWIHRRWWNMRRYLFHLDFCPYLDLNVKVK